VQWLLLKEHIQISAAQLAAFKALKDADGHAFDHNFRPTQPRNGRAIFSGDKQEWDYGGSPESSLGPADWGTIGFPTCGTQQGAEKQTPIDIPANQPSALPGSNLAFAWNPTALNLTNNGHTVQLSYPAGNSKITLKGGDYELKQFHFHAHSEHSVGGVSFPVELHFVHADATNALAVVGVFVKPGASNPEFAKFAAGVKNALISQGASETSHLAGCAAAPAGTQGCFKDPSVTLDASALLPKAQTLWSYDGSLTTPPCSEGVKWHVMTDPIEADQADIDALLAAVGEGTHHLDDNFRPVQPLNGRTIAAGVP
jgi:carbonic anhydrase